MSEHPLFDYAESQRHADLGIAVAAENNATLLVQAKQIAVRVAMEKPDRCISADDVQERLMVLGWPQNALGNAAGSLFRGREWRFTGRTVNSRRIQSHARMMRVWQYVGK